MGLPTFNTQDRSLSLLQSRWSAQLDPIVENPLLKGVQLKGIELQVGDNTINHLLQRPMQGYLVTSMSGAFTQLYSIASDMPNLTMILNSSAVATVDLYVF